MVYVIMFFSLVYLQLTLPVNMLSVDFLKNYYGAYDKTFLFKEIFYIFIRSFLIILLISMGVYHGIG